VTCVGVAQHLLHGPEVCARARSSVAVVGRNFWNVHGFGTGDGHIFALHFGQQRLVPPGASS